MKCKTCGEELTEGEQRLRAKQSKVCFECWKLAKSTDPIPYEMAKPKVYSIDLDNTLSIGSAWTCDECETLPPRQDMIDKVNELSEMNFIVIHTARRHGLYQSTIKWLEANHVRYHAICMAKMPADKIVDIDVINRVEDL